MKTIKMVSGIQSFFNSVTASDNTVIVNQNGIGSVYTYRAYGNTGDTVEVRGGFVGDEWDDMQHIATLTVNADNPLMNPQSTVIQHTWPVLALEGTAQLKIARGAV
jgi:hypothetical protein